MRTIVSAALVIVVGFAAAMVVAVQLTPMLSTLTLAVR
jgi:hypothetical protein